MNPTIRKFGYPATLVAEYEHWLVLLRPAQVTAGSLVLAARSDATAFGALPAAAFAELANVVGDIERTLASAINFDKINYLMLMMVDPEVHFHIFPRYAGERSWAGRSIVDRGWPDPPDLASAIMLEPDSIAGTAAQLQASWQKVAAQ